jgi:hypothetical protein
MKRQKDKSGERSQKKPIFLSSQATLVLLIIRRLSSLNRFLQSCLGLVEAPWLDTTFEKLIQLGMRETMSSQRIFHESRQITHPAGSGMMNQAPIAKGAPRPV